MGRRRFSLSLNIDQRAELLRHKEEMPPGPLRDRIRVILEASEGMHTLAGLARRAGCARSTIQLWLEYFQNGGVDALLNRGTPPGSTSPLTSGRVHSELMAGLAAGRWRSAEAVALWLKESHGITRSRKSIYYWFAKLGVSPASQRAANVR